MRRHLTADNVGRFVRHKRDERAILGLIEDKDVCDERFTAVDLSTRDLSEASADPGRARCGPSSDALLGAQFPDRFVLSSGAARGPRRLERRRN